MRSIASLTRSFLAEEDGATMVEYGLLTALIALVVVLAVVTLGSNLQARFDEVADCVASPTVNCP